MTDKRNNKQIKRLAQMRAAYPVRSVSHSMDVPVARMDAPAITVDLTPQTTTAYEYWTMLRKRWGVVVLAGVAGLAIAALLTLPQDKLYRASVALEVQGLNDNFLNTRDLDPTATTSPGYAESYVDTVVQLLQSKRLMNRVIQRLELEKIAEFQERPGVFRRLLDGADADKPTIPRLDYARGVVKDHMQVKSARTNRIVEVIFVSRDPQLAAKFANVAADEFIRESVDARWNSTERTAKWLDQHLEELREKLNASERELQRYSEAAALVFTGEADTVAMAKLRQIQEELSKAEMQRIARQSEHTLLRTSPVEALPAVLESSTIRDYQLRIAELKRQMAELAPTLKPAHYRIQQLQAQVEQMEKTVQQERTTLIGRMKNEFDSAQSREAMVRKAYQEQLKLVSAQSARAAHYGLLQREVETNRQLYDSMLQKVKDARLAAKMRASNIRIADEAEPPAEPYRPNLKLNTAIGGSLGLVLGMAFVIGSSRMGRSRILLERRILRPGDAKTLLHVPELGVIPQRTLRRGTPLARLLRNSEPEPEMNLELAVWQAKQTPTAESFRSIAASLLLSKGGMAPRVIVVTSPAPGDGKTTTASNLALALAEAGSPVLLIDGDMRRPRMHEIFQVPKSPGLGDLLAEGPQPWDVSAPQKSGAPNLWVLPAGKGGPEVGQQLYGSRMTELVNRFSQDYESVVIDAPPVLALADARFLGKAADGVILVVRSGSTHHEAAREARERLARDGTTVLGTVLNEWDPSEDKDTNGMYGYYYSRYEVNG